MEPGFYRLKNKLKKKSNFKNRTEINLKMIYAGNRGQKPIRFKDERE